MKEPDTPLQDLHDKINHIINTQKSISPVNRKKADLTPEVRLHILVLWVVLATLISFLVLDPA